MTHQRIQIVMYAYLILDIYPNLLRQRSLIVGVNLCTFVPFTLQHKFDVCINLINLVSLAY